MTAPMPASPGARAPFTGYLLPTRAPDPRLHVFLCDEDAPPGRPRTGLSASMAYEAHALGPLDRLPVPLELMPGPTSDGGCGFWEVDRQLTPGLYGLQVPVHLRRPGYTYLRLCFPATRPHCLILQGVDYDPYDRYALGLGTWARIGPNGPVGGHEHLTSGLRKAMPTVLRPLLRGWSHRDPREEPCSSP